MACAHIRRTLEVRESPSCGPGDSQSDVLGCHLVRVLRGINRVRITILEDDLLKSESGSKCRLFYLLGSSIPEDRCKYCSEGNRIAGTSLNMEDLTALEVEG